MRLNRKKILILNMALIMLIFTGCGSHIIRYDPYDQMSISEARETFEEMVLTQAINWRPDYIEINEKYILLNYASAQARAGKQALADVVIDGRPPNSISVTGERIYFQRIKLIQMLSTTRKFKKWYVVSTINADEYRKNIYYTRNIDEAKRLYDALNTLYSAYGFRKNN